MPKHNQLAPRQPAQVIQPDRALNADVARAERDGITAVARIHAAAFASFVAMQNASVLSRAADASFRVSPMGEHTYQAIMAAFGTVAVSEIQGLGFRNGGQR
jgi:hypothetical protein